jgi:hypothetical protein
MQMQQLWIDYSKTRLSKMECQSKAAALAMICSVGEEVTNESTVFAAASLGKSREPGQSS